MTLPADMSFSEGVIENNNSENRTLLLIATFSLGLGEPTINKYLNNIFLL